MVVKQYISGYYCRDELEIEILNKPSNRLILEALQDAYPSGLTAHKLEERTGIPRNTIYSQLKELYREYFVLEAGHRKEPKPRGRPAKSNDVSERHREEVIFENSNPIFDTRVYKGVPMSRLAPGNVEYSDEMAQLWSKFVASEELDGISLLLFRFLKQIVTRTVESEDIKVRKIAPTKKIEHCCFQCGVNHEARDFMRAISLHVIDNLEKSKPYVDFLKENDFITEEAYSQAKSKIVETETSQKWLDNELKELRELIQHFKQKQKTGQS